MCLRIALAATALLAVTACGGGQAGPSGPAATASRAIQLVASEFKFDPTESSASAGQVAFTIRNSGSIEHDFELIDEKGASLAKIPIIAPGSSERVSATLAAGRYSYVCTLPGHKQAGMVGSVAVR